jgi:hypothetical protein
MTTATHDRFRHLERSTLLVAAVTVLAAAWLGWRSPGDIATAWRFAVFACLQPAIGSLVFVLIHRLTGGRWMDGLAPFLAAGTRLLPWVWLLAVPLLWWPVATKNPERALASVDATSGMTAQVQPAPVALERAMSREESRHLDERVRWYFSRPMVALRAGVYAAGFFLLAAGAKRVMTRRDASYMRWFGPAGLVSLVFALHLFATDWFVLLEPGWYSTGFPLVWITAQALAGLAVALLVALSLGADPDRAARSAVAPGIDWGNLLLASVMAWTYVAFVQWLIIWSGNLPAETAWYRHRAEGGWRWVIAGVTVLEFAVPFALLLSRRVKRRRIPLACVAAAVVLGQLGYTAWLILPGLAPRGLAAVGLIACTSVAAAALFLNRYLAVARRAEGVLAP